MGLKSVKGDLLQMLDNGVFDIVAHGCNCFHAMGAGFAGKLAERYPQVPRADTYHSELGDRSKLGSYTHTVVDTPSGKRVRVANLYTQFYYGPRFRGGHHFRIEHLQKALDSLLREFPNQLVGIPLIGGGLGEGPVNQIRELIAHFQSQKHQLVLVELP